MDTWSRHTHCPRLAVVSVVAARRRRSDAAAPDTDRARLQIRLDAVRGARGWGEASSRTASCSMNVTELRLGLFDRGYNPAADHLSRWTRQGCRQGASSAEVANHRDHARRNPELGTHATAGYQHWAALRIPPRAGRRHPGRLARAPVAGSGQRHDRPDAAHADRSGSKGLARISH